MPLPAAPLGGRGVGPHQLTRRTASARPSRNANGMPGLFYNVAQQLKETSALPCWKLGATVSEGAVARS